MIEIKVPTVGESISEVQLLRWNKKTGDYVERDEVIAELESEKATFEVNAEKAGVLTTVATEGDQLKIGELLATIDDTAKASPAKVEITAPKPPAVATVQNTAPAQKLDAQKPAPAEVKATPLASALLAEKKVDLSQVKATGPQGKIVKEDVLKALEQPGRIPFENQVLSAREQRKEKMSNLRKTIAKRLVEAKNGTAMLTTFNEVDMSAILAIRASYKDKFKEVHGVGLGFMSFFAKACSVALREWPSVNASIDGDTILYHDYADISIAVSTPRGLTVPVMRNVESMSMADVEKKVAELAVKARDSKLTAEELTGGTFTITNGGVFGSLMSTPIINAPQSAILGMHKIQERPMVEKGQVVVRPMMYLALSYDHRIIDGRESVGFLVRVKELLENPAQLLIGKDPVKTLLEI
ncbi:MAG: 2-oxoglutarate dehydrogenase complex dihydrolipoyllysine-residue succinyltransferase [Terrimonas sp.]|jgi:2-oxoglutarate dehydrogenase E2 component (dihydrolipoamide succinyltransferase)|nr:2-oxoglutarate dehydrogenase complex dihydrolipoyllysine-residue succinyltransferase [Terrimonas sp.]